MEQHHAIINPLTHRPQKYKINVLKKICVKEMYRDKLTVLLNSVMTDEVSATKTCDEKLKQTHQKLSKCKNTKKEQQYVPILNNDDFLDPAGVPTENQNIQHYHLILHSILNNYCNKTK